MRPSASISARQEKTHRLFQLFTFLLLCILRTLHGTWRVFQLLLLLYICDVQEHRCMLSKGIHMSQSKTREKKETRATIRPFRFTLTQETECPQTFLQFSCDRICRGTLLICDSVSLPLSLHIVPDWWMGRFVAMVLMMIRFAIVHSTKGRPHNALQIDSWRSH